MVEHAAVNRRVVGSSPTGGAREEVLIKILMRAFCTGNASECLKQREYDITEE